MLMGDNKWEVVYHYTSLNGFERILTSGSLALTDIIKSNDPAEGLYPLQMLKEAYNKLYNESSITYEEYDKCRQVYFDFYNGEHCFGRLQQIVLSLSFCEPKLELALWRSYGDNGRGVAIGIAKERLRAIASKEGFAFKPIEYLSESELIERYCMFWRKHIACDDNSLLKALREEYINGYFIKRCENSFEREWRLVYTGLNLEDYTLFSPSIPDELGSFVKGNDIVIYYKLKINDGDRLVDYIRIGPQCKITCNEMRWVLGKNRIKYCAVDKDSIVMR